MLTIETYLKEVPGKGIGLFTSKKIHTGVVWHIDEHEFDKTYSKNWVESNGLIDFFHHYATYNKTTNEYYLCSDNARFVNHSETPNTAYNSDNGCCIVIKDINEGEEITCDYRTICDYDKENGLNFEVK